MFRSDRRLGWAAAYFLLQGSSTILWWAALIALPEWRKPFLPPGGDEKFLFAFLYADLPLMALASFLAAYGLRRQRPWAWGVLCLQAGAAAYAGLLCLGTWIETDTGVWSLALMIPPLFVPLTLAWWLRPRDS